MEILELLIGILKEYGIWGLILAVLLFLLLKGEVVFRYPRSPKGK